MSIRRIAHITVPIGYRVPKKGIIGSPNGIAGYKVALRIHESQGRYTSPVDLIATMVKEKITKEKPKIFVLDEGCGAGRFLNETKAELISRGISPQVELIGMDISCQKYQVIEYEKGKPFPKTDESKCEDHHFNFVIGDAQKYIFRKEVELADGRKIKLDNFKGFDVIYSLNTLQYIERKDEALENSYNMLALGGVAYFHMIRRTCMVEIGDKLVPLEESVLPEMAKQIPALTYKITASAVIIRLEKLKYQTHIAFHLAYKYSLKHKMSGGCESEQFIVSVYKKEDQPV